MMQQPISKRRRQSADKDALLKKEIEKRLKEKLIAHVQQRKLSFFAFTVFNIANLPTIIIMQSDYRTKHKNNQRIQSIVQNTEGVNKRL